MAKFSISFKSVRKSRAQNDIAAQFVFCSPMLDLSVQRKKEASVQIEHKTRKQQIKQMLSINKLHHQHTII